MAKTCVKQSTNGVVTQVHSLYKVTTISTILTKKLGLYDSLIFSKMRDVIAYASSLGLETKRASNVLPKNSDIPVKAEWTKLQIKQIAKLLPFLSSRTVERHLKNLEDNTLVYCSPLNESPVDTTCWYAINTDKLQAMLN